LAKSISAYIEKLKEVGGQGNLVKRLEFLKTAVVISGDGTVYGAEWRSCEAMVGHSNPNERCIISYSICWPVGT